MTSRHTTLSEIPTRRPESRTAIARELGECVYAVHTPDGLIKIGHTGNLDRRIRKLGCTWADVLVVVSADAAYEQAVHARLAAHRARGIEYYEPVPQVMAWVNRERSVMGLSAVA